MRTAAVMAALAGLLAAPPVEAAPSVVVRVLSEAADVRTGPSFAYRAVYVAARGETLQAIERAPGDHWFRVVLPDGTYGWILGDEVLPIAVDPAGQPPPGLGQRFVEAVFSPAPLARGDVGLCFSAGMLGGEGMALFRPSYLLAPHIGIEAAVGETVGERLDTVYYGLGANLYLWPTSPVTPFFALGGGGAHRRWKADQKVSGARDDIRTDYTTANVGGGIMFAFKKRITLRFDFRNHVLFDPDTTRNLQEYSGGLAVIF
jgi:hypothetical protein